MEPVQYSGLLCLRLAHRTFAIPFRQIPSEGSQLQSTCKWLQEHRTLLWLCLDLKTAPPLANRSASLTTPHLAPPRDLRSQKWPGARMPTLSLPTASSLTCLRFQSHPVVLS